MTERDRKISAMLLSGLVACEESRLADFRRTRLGHGAVEVEELRRLREVLIRLGDGLRVGGAEASALFEAVHGVVIGGPREPSFPSEPALFKAVEVVDAPARIPPPPLLPFLTATEEEASRATPPLAAPPLAAPLAAPPAAPPLAAPPATPLAAPPFAAPPLAAPPAAGTSRTLSPSGTLPPLEPPPVSRQTEPPVGFVDDAGDEVLSIGAFEDDEVGRPEAEADRPEAFPQGYQTPQTPVPPPSELAERASVEPLPFRKSQLDLNAQGNAASFPELSVETYASMRALSAAFPERRRDTLLRYGIADESMAERLEVHWEVRLAAEPELAATVADMVERYRAWFEANG